MIESTLPDTLINSVAAQKQESVYLTKAQRHDVETAILTSGTRGTQGLNTKNVSDVWLCRMLLNVRALLFAEKAFEQPYRGIPRQLIAKGFRP